jgi:hypothetical protein
VQREGTGALVERALIAGVLTGAAVGLGLALINGLSPVQRPWTFGQVLALSGAAAGGLGALLLLPIALWLRRAPRGAWLATWLAPGLALIVGLVLVAEWLAVRREVAPGPLLPRAAFFALIVATAGQARVRFRWRHAAWIARALAVLAAALTIGATWPRTPPVPSRPASVRPAVPRPSTPPLLVFGIDGADWDFIEPLIARGELPALAALRARGAWGVLKTVRPTLSPVIWTTIATGRTPRAHGIHGFVTETLRGVDAPLPDLRAPGSVTRAFVDGLRRTGCIDSGPVRSDARRVPAFWNLATREGSPVHVVDWWATWPAERVLGAMVSERVYYRSEAELGSGRLTWPRDLGQRLRSLIVRREQVTYEEARRFLELTPEEFAGLGARPARERTLEAQLTYFCALTETDRRVALHLTEAGRRGLGRPPDLLVLFRLVDMVSHTSAQYSELVDDHLGATPDELRRYGRVVSEAYRTVDRALGDLLAAFGPEANVVVLSDHGFELQAHPPDFKPSYDHRNGAAGVFVAAGPAFRPGRAVGLGVLDIFPLLAELKGFPLADDLEGRPARRTLGELFVGGEEPRRLPSYGPRDAWGGEGEGAADDPELLERLRALGYL